MQVATKPQPIGTDPMNAEGLLVTTTIETTNKIIHAGSIVRSTAASMEVTVDYLNKMLLIHTEPSAQSTLKTTLKFLTEDLNAMRKVQDLLTN